ncbi:MAG: hypothetical protein RRY22_04870 [Bacilli bacterium]
MKKKFKILILTFLLLMLPSFTKAWDEIGTGGGYPVGSISECSSTDGDGKNRCFCDWNNMNFSALKMSLIYYDGLSKRVIGRPVAYYKSDNPGWVSQRLGSGAINASSWFPNKTIINAPSFSNDLKNILIGNGEEANGYQRIRAIFSDMGVDYERLLASARGGSSFYDSVNGVNYGRIVNQKIGTNGRATKGVRIMVEPIFSIETTGNCPSYNSTVDYLMTIKNLVAFTYNSSGPKYDGGLEYMRGDNWGLSGYANTFYLDGADAGFSAVPGRIDKYNVFKVADPNSGWGLNLYGPFDNVVSKCDPDKEYDGYKNGVDYCCSTEDIQSYNSPNNSTNTLTRVLTRYEFDSICSKSAKKCNPNSWADGIEACCGNDGTGIDINTFNYAGHPKNNTNYLTRKIDLSELVGTSCDNNGNGNNCAYGLDVSSPKVCTKDGSTGKVIDAANWGCVFKSTKSGNDSTVKSHYFENAASNNQYCAVYCKEEINYSLPAGGIEVYAGRFMVVGETVAPLPKIDPIVYKGKKVCRLTGSKGSTSGQINYNKFNVDLNRLEDDVRTYWDEWKIWETQKAACDRGTTVYYNGNPYDCPGNPKPNYSSQIAASKIKYEKAVRNRDGAISNINDCVTRNITSKFDPSVSLYYDEEVYGKTPSKNPKEFRLRTVKREKEETQTYYNSGNATYSSAVGNNEPTYRTMYKYTCNGNTPCTKTQSFRVPTTLWWEKSIEITNKYGLPENTYRFVSKATGQSFNSRPEAGGENAIDVGYDNLPIHYSTSPGRYSFTVVTNSFGEDHKFNKYILEGKKFNNVLYEQANKYECTFIVSCEKPVITDDQEEYCEICKEQVSTCGNEKCDPNDPKCLPCEEDDPDCPKTDKCHPGDPDCPPCIGTDCYPAHLDINLIYRPISLAEIKENGKTFSGAFVGREGRGRKPGENWNMVDTINNVITNNRGVKEYEIYKRSPMYEITLNPGLMKKIRAYNKTLNSKQITIYEGTKPSTGIAGYSDFESMECASATDGNGGGKECKSKKIREWKITGCGIKGFDLTKYNKCTGHDRAW